MLLSYLGLWREILMLNKIKTLFFLVILLSAFSSFANNSIPTKPDDPMEELEEIEWFIKHPPAGIVFTVREYDDYAFKWVAQRLNYYIYLLRTAHPKLPIEILSHGDEVSSLSKASTKEYDELHRLIKLWKKQGITTHACGTMAKILELDDSDFPSYIDIVPYGPSQVQDYKELDYEHIELEVTW